MNSVNILQQFVEPKSVAIVGATRKSGEFSLNVVDHLRNYGYEGQIYPVNPNAEEIAGLKAYDSVLDIPDPVELAVIMTPRETVPDMLRQCAQKGIRCASIIAQGFSDAKDETSRRLHEEMMKILKETGIRALGPNTFGTANAFVKFSSSFARIVLDPNPVGIVCQTGFFFHGFPEFRFSGKCIDLGNNCDLDFADALEYYEQDDQVKVIGLHIEGMKDYRRFLEVARRVVRKKPIVALKTGKSERAARAIQSHSGSLAGSDLIWDSALKAAGIIRVVDVEDFLDTIRMFTIAPLMKTNKIAISTFSGGAGIMGMDAFHNGEVEVAPLSKATYEKLEARAPGWLHVGNPVDYWPIMMGHPNQFEIMRDVMDILLDDDELGGAVYMQVSFQPQVNDGLRWFLNHIADKHPGKPFISAISGTYNADLIANVQKDGKTLVYPTPERASRAFARLWQYSRLRLGL
jgi:acetyltransferase